MRIVGFPASFAVLLLTAIFFFSKFPEFHSSPLSSQEECYNITKSKDIISSNPEIVEDELNPVVNRSIPTLHHWMNVEQSEKLLMVEGGESKLPVECCPSMTEITSPDGGRNIDGMYVQLYKDENQRQQFYETSCRPEILNQPCRFMEKRFHYRSQCVQKYAFSYAIVIPSDETNYSQHKFPQKHFSPMFHNKSNTYRLDHIQVRSGCSCEIMSTKFKKGTRRKKKQRKPTED